MHAANSALARVQRPVGRFAAAARSLWVYLRRVSGDDAYERYVTHLRDNHPEVTPESAREYFRRRHEEKWSRPSRCC